MTIPKFESDYKPGGNLKPFEVRGEEFNARKMSFPLLALIRENYAHVFEADEDGNKRIQDEDVIALVGDLLTEESAERLIPMINDLDNPLEIGTVVGIIQYVVGKLEVEGVDDDPKAETLET